MYTSKQHILYGFILVILIVFAIFISTSKNSFISSSSARHYKASFSSASGLGVGNDVRISGSSIGKITRIWLSKDLQANVEMLITTPINIPIDSYVVIHNIGITGNMYVDLEPGAEEEYLKDNEWFDNTQGTISLHRMLMLGLSMVKKKGKK